MAAETPVLVPRRHRVDESEPGTDAPLHWRHPRTWTRGDRIAVGVLAAIPLVLFIPLALAGHPAITADNLLQNYPLRLLSARQINAGHWPTWNPYSYSGTPLLAGMNAGSLFPGSLLFTFLPGIVAWITNLIVVYWCAGIGMYVLLRWMGFSSIPSAFASLFYAFSGQMVGQLVHVGVIEGQAMLPLVILCQFMIARAVLSADRTQRTESLVRRALPPALWLAVLCGLIGLTGEPRSIVDAEVIVALVAGFELVLHGSSVVATLRGKVAYVTATVLSVSVGLAIAAVQLLPGWDFITNSERSKITYFFWGKGSMPWRWLSVIFDPGTLGDNGVAHTSRFLAAYNLPEVTSYVGLLALAATFAFGAQLLGRSVAMRRALVPFFVLVVVGAVTALGSDTPLGHLFHHVPLFGKTRLQNRNLIFVDLGACVLLAWWLDTIRKGQLAAASLTGRRRLATVAPIVISLGLGLWGALSPASLVLWISADGTPARLTGGARPVLIISTLLAVALLVVLFGLVDVRRLRRALVAFAIVDLAFFNLFFQSGLISGLPSPFPDTPQAHEILGTHGRIAIVDPAVLSYHIDATLGFGNLDAYTQLQSVQGYGSLVAARYSDATGARLLGTLGGCQLARGNFEQLRLEVLAVSRNALVGTPRAQSCDGMLLADTKRYFGLVLNVKKIRFAGPDVGTVGQRAHVGLIEPDGTVTSVPVTLRTNRRRVLWVTFPTHPRAAGVELSVAGGAEVNSAIVYPTKGSREPLNTSMQVGLSVQPWHLTEVQNHLSYFRTKIRPPVWLLGSPDGVARVERANAEGGLTVSVRSPVATTLVRSEAWLPGWVARVRVAGSTATTTLPVTANGLVQSVKLPAGTLTVQFAYIAPFLAEGQSITVAGLVVLLAGFFALRVLRRRHRRRHDPAATTPA